MLAKCVFQVIAHRFAARIGDFQQLGDTGYSFEEWCNWEMFLACRAAGLSASPRPSYRRLGVADSGRYADLLTHDPSQSERVLVELGIAHDWTTDKWLSKLDGDTAKLQQVNVEGITKLQIILVVTAKHHLSDDLWQGWLRKLKCWNQRTDLDTILALPTNGELMLRGWIVT
ncbi:MAG: hypothetical protein PHU85_10970 [Phycisphaerae bacterium]|nr:hypothetical protein [Phycisphaerae bacterium]